MGENDDPLETIYHTLLIIFYVALPLLMTILRCFTMKNIPKVDLVFLFFAITFWFWIIWFSTILTNDLVSWAPLSNFAFNVLISVRTLGTRS